MAGYSFSEELEKSMKEFGIKDKATEPEITETARKKGRIEYKLVERLYEEVKKIPSTQKVGDIDFEIGWINGEGDSNSELNYYMRRMEKNYLLDLKRAGAIDSLEFRIETEQEDALYHNYDFVRIEFDVSKLKRVLKRAVAAKKKFRETLEFDAKTGFLRYLDKSIKFSSAKNLKILKILWKDRRKVDGDAVLKKGSVWSVNNIYLEVFKTSDSETRFLESVRDIRKQFKKKGFPIDIEHKGGFVQLVDKSAVRD